LGSIFELITDGKFKATFHRVLDIGRERYSSPFFFEPSYYTHIPMNLINDSDDYVLYGDWWSNNQLEAGEWSKSKIKKKMTKT